MVSGSPIIYLNSDVRDLINEQKSLKRLKFNRMDMIDWKWDQLFGNLSKLREFSMQTSTISSPLFRHSDPFTTNDNLISFSVTNCAISSIEENVMSQWTQLKMISLANNCIKDLNRKWLAPNLKKLWSLDLSFNSIDYIPKDFFIGMTALRKLRLDNNSLKTLKKLWFEPIWAGLHEFWIDGEPHSCLQLFANRKFQSNACSGFRSLFCNFLISCRLR